MPPTTPDGWPRTTGLIVCAAADVEDGTPIQVEVQGLTLAVFNVNGRFHVTDDACTHGPGLLSEGYLEGHVVECNFHGGQFDVRTGQVLAPPCVAPVKAYPTVVLEGKVVIDPKSDAAPAAS